MGGAVLIALHGLWRKTYMTQVTRKKKMRTAFESFKFNGRGGTRPSARGLRQKTFCQRPSATKLLQEAFCKRPSTKDLQRKTFCKRPFAKDLLQKTFCKRPSARTDPVTFTHKKKFLLPQALGYLNTACRRPWFHFIWLAAQHRPDPVRWKGGKSPFPFLGFLFDK